MGKDLKGKELGKGLRQRPDGTYEGRYTVRGVTRSIYGANLDDVRLKVELEKSRVKDDISAVCKDYTLDEWFAEWVETYKAKTVKVSSLQTIKTRYKNGFGRMIGAKKVKSIKSMDIQRCINQLKDEGRKCGYICNIVSEVRECLEHARNNGLIQKNPCFDAVTPRQKTPKMERRFLTSEEQARFLENVKIERPWYTEYYYVMFLTGMRVGEIGGLTWDDVDFDNNEIHIRHNLVLDYYGVNNKQLFLGEPKTIYSYRTIPMFGECKEMLLSQKKKQAILKEQLGDRYRAKIDNLVFCSEMGSEVGRNRAYDNINRVVKLINDKELRLACKEGRQPNLFEMFNPHAIRHSFASRCYEVGIDIKTTQKLMGHASIEMTMDLYTHFSKSKYDEAVEKFGRITG